MKLKRYTPQTINTQRSTGPRISFHTKGVISFSKTTVKLMDIGKGKCVEFLHDEDNPGDWYVTKDSDGFKLYKNGESGMLRVKSTEVAKEVFKSVNFRGTYFRFRLGEMVIRENKELWPIITAPARKKEYL